MAKTKVLTDDGLSVYHNNNKKLIKDSINYENIVAALGYIPAEASDLSHYKFEIINGNLFVTYPDDSPAPDLHIDANGHLIWTYVE